MSSNPAPVYQEEQVLDSVNDSSLTVILFSFFSQAELSRKGAGNHLCRFTFSYQYGLFMALTHVDRDFHQFTLSCEA